jgi:hypothetical protein
MEQADLHAFILDRLTGAVNPDDIVMELCEKHGLAWPEAEALVLEIQSEHGNAITRRQSPLLTIIALGLFLGGLALIGISAYSLIEIVQSYSQADLFYTDMPGALMMILEYGYGSLATIGLGAAIVLGSLVGMRRVWAAILDF